MKLEFLSLQELISAVAVVLQKEMTADIVQTILMQTLFNLFVFRGCERNNCWYKLRFSFRSYLTKP